MSSELLCVFNLSYVYRGSFLKLFGQPYLHKRVISGKIEFLVMNICKISNENTASNRPLAIHSRVCRERRYHNKDFSRKYFHLHILHHVITQHP